MLSVLPSLLKPPRRETPIFSCSIDADIVACRIAQPGFAPQPGLVLRILVKFQAGIFQASDFCIDALDFEVDHRFRLSQRRLCGVQRE